MASKLQQSILGNYRALFLLASLLLFILILPFFETSMLGTVLVMAFFTLVLLSGIYAVSYDMKAVKMGLLLAIPAFLSMWGEVFQPNKILELFGYVFLALFLIYTLFMVLRKVLSTSYVTINEIYGAISVYIMLGLTFAQFYGLIYEVAPDSFKFQYGTATVSSFLYFSFATLTTVGFGDILATIPAARSVVIIEMITGMMYVAVLIGKLIGANTSNERK
jgi:hypothetical protein